MATWTVFGARKQRKVRIGGKNNLMIADDIFWSLWGQDIETSEALEEGTIQLEILIGEEPRTFALRPCATGMPITFRRSVRNGAKLWRGSVNDAAYELSLEGWRGRPMDTIWSTEDDKLVVAVPLSGPERDALESDEEEEE